ncbi:unnamed protein product [Cylicocyclus nassatus]|uniref:Uncharacterized protein n=1 Tax=Cylicocyclus nassatus TaxID=53992 RepID=A0AA36H551_CYLNA|nr:unnamed protein product [Cylicocyclus nassatus]
MAPYTVLVTGANRGIGLGLVKQFLKNKDIKHVIATTKDESSSKENQTPESQEGLKQISDKRLKVVELDLTCDNSVKNMYPQVEKIVGDHGLNVLLNNAGIFVNYTTNQKPDRSALIKNFDTNAASVAVLTQTLLPLVRKAAKQSQSDEFSIERAAILNISASIGSISENTSGSGHPGLLAYRISKAALNALMRTMAVDLEKDRILVANFNPGWVETAIGGKQAPMTVDEAAERLVPTFYKLTKEHNGGFFEADLKPIPF